jgi:hypothetical protein
VDADLKADTPATAIELGFEAGCCCWPAAAWWRPRGMGCATADGLLGFPACLPPTMRRAVNRLVGSGNARRLNPALRRIFEPRSGMPLSVPAHRAEAGSLVRCGES